MHPWLSKPFGLEVVNSLDCPKSKYQQHYYTLSLLLAIALAFMNTVSVKKTSNIHTGVEILTKIHEKLQAFVSSDKQGFG